MKFKGQVRFRSSVAPGQGPPGEAEIQKLNPLRVAEILRVTGWARLEPGSLNLQVDPSVVSELNQGTPTLFEDASTIKYPSPYGGIPRLRGGYSYYLGVVQVGSAEQEVLVRRAVNPRKDRVELFAPVSLKEHFTLSPGSVVEVSVEV